MTDILCDKVLISSFSKFQISTTFSTFYDTYEFKVTRFILFVFINKMVIDVLLT